MTWYQDAHGRWCADGADGRTYVALAEGRRKNTMTLRDYQRTDIERLRNQYRKGNQSVLYTLPTGGGKTIVFAHIAKESMLRGNRVMILVHRQELLQQCSRALTLIGVAHGCIHPDAPRTDHAVQVASVFSVREQHSDLIIIDEAHHAPAGTWTEIIANNPRARVLGVTATPCRMDGRGLAGVFQSLVIGPDMRTLVDNGYLSPCEVWAPAVPDLSGVRSRGGDYVRKAIDGLMRTGQVTGCAVEHYRMLCDAKPSLCYCTSVQHAIDVADAFRVAGYTAEPVYGAMPTSDRERIMRRFADGGLHILTSCDLISEGLDVPGAHAAILLRPTKSLALYMQQCGRAMRPAPDKEKAIIIDHAGNALRHGLPDMPRQWTLEHGAKQQAGKGLPPVRRCPKCYHVQEIAPTECLRCGYHFEIKQKKLTAVEGMLSRLTHDDIEQLKNTASTLTEWHVVAKATGHSPGWAWMRWKGKYARV